METPENDRIILPNHQLEEGENIDSIFLQLESEPPSQQNWSIFYEKLIDYVYVYKSQAAVASNSIVSHEIRIFRHIGEHYQSFNDPSISLSAIRLIASIFDVCESGIKSLDNSNVCSFITSQLLASRGTDDVSLLIPTIMATSHCYFNLRKDKSIPIEVLSEIAINHRSSSNDMLRRLAAWSIAFCAYNNLVDEQTSMTLLNFILYNNEENNLHVMKHYPVILLSVFSKFSLSPPLIQKIYALCLRWAEHPSIIMRSRVYPFLQMLVVSRRNSLDRHQIYTIYSIASDAFKNMKSSFIGNEHANARCVANCISFLKGDSAVLPISNLIEAISAEQDTKELQKFYSWLRIVLIAATDTLSADMVFSFCIGSLFDKPVDSSDDILIAAVGNCLAETLENNPNRCSELHKRVVSSIATKISSIDILEINSNLFSIEAYLLGRRRFDIGIIYEIDAIIKEKLLLARNDDIIIVLLKLYGAMFTLLRNSINCTSDHFKMPYLTILEVIKLTNKSILKTEALLCIANCESLQFDIFLTADDKIALIEELVKPTIDESDAWSRSLCLFLCDSATNDWIPNHLIDPALAKFHERALDLIVERLQEEVDKQNR